MLQNVRKIKLLLFSKYGGVFSILLSREAKLSLEMFLVNLIC